VLGVSVCRFPPEAVVLSLILRTRLSSSFCLTRLMIFSSICTSYAYFVLERVCVHKYRGPVKTGWSTYYSNESPRKSRQVTQKWIMIHKKGTLQNLRKCCVGYYTAWEQSKRNYLFLINVKINHKYLVYQTPPLLTCKV